MHYKVVKANYDDAQGFKEGGHFIQDEDGCFFQVIPIMRMNLLTHDNIDGISVVDTVCQFDLPEGEELL